MTSLKGWPVVSAGLVIALFAADPCAAQDKKSIRNFAKTVEAKLRAAGEPRDRCALGASFADGAVVTRSKSDSQLKPGDRLISIGGTNISGKTAEEAATVLRGLPPTATIDVVLSRDGKDTTLPVSCISSRPVIEPLMSAISLAALGKFDECVSVLQGMDYVDRSVALLKAQCASVSKKSKGSYPTLLVEALKLEIEDASYAPSLRPTAIADLRGSEGLITNSLGAGKFNELVSLSRQWPGGDRQFEQSAPDWAAYRVQAEKALRSKLIDPDSARIEWTNGFLLGWWKPPFSKQIDGYWTCGRINARNRMGGYAGSTAFVVVLDPSGFVKYAEVGQSKDFDMLTSQCGNSVKLLPPAPRSLVAEASSQVSPPPTSLADEVKKLVELRNSGALTEPEFQAAKRKLLGESVP